MTANIKRNTISTSISIHKQDACSFLRCVLYSGVYDMR